MYVKAFGEYEGSPLTESEINYFLSRIKNYKVRHLVAFNKSEGDYSEPVLLIFYEEEEEA